MDESGFMLQPVVRRTWAPAGQPPIHYTWDRHDRLSVIAAITISPKQHRLDVYFKIHSQNIKTDAAEDFIVDLRRTLGRKRSVVWNEWSVHRSAARNLQKRFPKTLQFSSLPPYAPDLNPVEQIWAHTKYGDLANFIPEDRDHLERETWLSVRTKHYHTNLIRSLFSLAQLSIL